MSFFSPAFLSNKAASLFSPKPDTAPISQPEAFKQASDHHSLPTEPESPQPHLLNPAWLREWEETVQAHPIGSSFSFLGRTFIVTSLLAEPWYLKVETEYADNQGQIHSKTFPYDHPALKPPPIPKP